MSNNNVIIDVYGDGSLVVEGKVGDRALVQIPEQFKDNFMESETIAPWVDDMKKIGLDFVEDTAYGVVFNITELAVTKKE